MTKRTEGDEKTTTTNPTRKPGNAKPAAAAPEPVPFQDALDYLETWFLLLEPPTAGAGGARPMGRIPSPEEKAACCRLLVARTERSLATGVDLPFETFVRSKGFDGADRLILLALLKAAHDPEGDGGLSFPRLCGQLGASSLSQRRELHARLETAGRLRDHGVLHGYPHPNGAERQYRLAPWLVEPLTTGAGDPEGLPRISEDATEALQELRFEVARVVEAVGMDSTKPIVMWQAPAEGREGWDPVALRRRRLAARLEASVRCATSPAGAEIRRLGLEGDERLAWAFLLHDAQADPVGVAVPLLVRFAGRFRDPEAEARRLFGPGSKLAGGDCVRFNRSDGPFLGRLVWLSREASMRVVPWSRDAFVVRMTTDGEPVAGATRRLGFDVGGAMKEDRAAAAAGREAR